MPDEELQSNTVSVRKKDNADRRRGLMISNEMFHLWLVINEPKEKKK